MSLSFTHFSFFNQVIKSCLAITLLISLSQAHAKFDCELNQGYELPADIGFNWLCSFSNELAPAQQISTEKYGAVNRQGVAAIPFEYDSPVEFIQSRALVKKADKWVLINTANHKIAEFDFQEAWNFTPVGLAQFQQDDKWGYINTSGEVVIQPQFDSIVHGFGYPLLNENVIAIFELDGKQGAINQAGKIIIPAQFDDIRRANDILFVSNNDKVGIYDYQGNMIQPVEFEFTMVNGFYSDNRWTNENWLSITKNGKVGAIDKRGNIIVPTEFDDVEIISENTFKVSKNGKYGIHGINNLITPLKFDYIANSLEGPTRVKLDGKWGYLDRSDSLMMVDYDEAYDFSEGLAMVGNNQKQQFSQKDESKSWGYINTIGEEVISLHYEDARPFEEGLAPVRLNGKWGVIDFQENQIVPFEYDAISSFEDGYAIVARAHPKIVESSTKLDKKIYEGTEYSISSDWDNDEFYINNLSDRDVSKMKFGLINRQGGIVLATDYENVTRVSEGMIGIKNNNKWGFANQQGELVFPYQFDQIFPPFKEGTIQVDNCFDDNENPISCQSDEVNSHTMHVDKQGNIINELWGSSSVTVEVEETAD
ncbi:WG repeat-containing protein [Psychrobacter glaciei]|uniref:WG repeat-containing protein n=1 Tax=Psychrobacter glaciei TaxID=619771 RepID=UPI001F070C58|nr:WG repeat-containing protein [Psychrobacter glaciei]MCH1783553.1 WG repeat-containing protein [Psychrobacter glaciei]